MSLATYKKKRNFAKTPEPRGQKPRRAPHALHYIIQKHDASRLHYDFRLELDGTLKSWAVPKGPSLDPDRKALAVQVEDHPLDYETFEGVIPKGQYGGGTVMLWDRGTWEPLEDPHEGLKRGKLRFELHGEKLHGQWSLVQMHGSAGADGKNWLLMKLHDQYAGTTDILHEESESVSTHRTLEQIAAQRDAVWDSHAGKVPPESHDHAQAPPKKTTTSRAAKITSADKMPTRIEPQLAVLAEHPPNGEPWLHEIKFDGYRLIAFLNHGQVTLHTRKGLDWTARFANLVPPLTKLQADTAILDGEAVVLNDKGQSDFQALQAMFKSKTKANLHYFAFDLLYLNGQDLRETPLLERKSLLETLLKNSGNPIDYSDHVRGDGTEVIRRACALGSEGIVSKRADAPYVSRRDPSWQKSKCGRRQEFIIIGYTPSEKREGFRSLLLGINDPENGLIYCGRVGTGFDTKKRRDLLADLQKLEQKSPPTNLPPPVREQRAGHWVKPQLVCEVQFEGWTKDNVLRHPSYIALRLDKPAPEVTREIPADAPAKVAKKPHKTAPQKTPPSPPKIAQTTDKQWAGIRMTHPDKLLYPQDNVRKQDLADYYAIAAPFMLPHVIDRPLALMRCPSGTAGKCFFMRNWSNTLPPDIDKIKIGKGEAHVMIHNAAGLFSMAQISALEIHTWNCHAKNIEHPDQIVFDLDPGPEVSWKQLVNGAQILRDLLLSLKMSPFLKTSGGKGLHITVPILPNVEWPEAKAFTKTLATHLASEHDLFIVNMSKALRTHKIYMDFLRNQRSATAVAPYSSRARPGAAVSMPIEWDQLTQIKSSSHFTIKNAASYLEKRKSDPWANFPSAAIDLHKITQPAPITKE